MKKNSILLFVILFIALIVLFCACSPSPKDDYLRIHIRADSNSEFDQSVKYMVKNEIVAYLTPLLSTCTTKQKAMDMVETHLTQIEQVADKTLAGKGLPYKAKAKLTREEFPPRAYDGLTLDAGIYDALILNLGSGTGDNWWCVVYPPLCFIGGQPNGTEQITYRSKLLEIIEEFQNK